MVVDFKVHYHTRPGLRDYISKVYAVDPRDSSFLLYNPFDKKWEWHAARYCRLVEEKE